MPKRKFVLYHTFLFLQLESKDIRVRTIFIKCFLVYSSKAQLCLTPFLAATLFCYYNIIVLVKIFSSDVKSLNELSTLY